MYHTTTTRLLSGNYNSPGARRPLGGIGPFGEASREHVGCLYAADQLRAALAASPADTALPPGTCTACRHPMTWHETPIGCVGGWDSDEPQTSGCRCSGPTDTARAEA